MADNPDVCVRFSPSSKLQSYAVGGMRLVRRPDIKWYIVPNEVGERLRYVVDNASRCSPRIPAFDVHTPDEMEKIDAYEEEKARQDKVERRGSSRRKMRAAAVPPAPQSRHPALMAGAPAAKPTVVRAAVAAPAPQAVADAPVFSASEEWDVELPKQQQPLPQPVPVMRKEAKQDKVRRPPKKTQS